MLLERYEPRITSKEKEITSRKKRWEMVDGDIAQGWIRKLRQNYCWLIEVGRLITERYWVQRICCIT